MSHHARTATRNMRTMSESTLLDEYVNTNERFFSGVSYIPRNETLANSDRPQFGDTTATGGDNETWQIKIGDLVCVQVPDPTDTTATFARDDYPPGKAGAAVPFTVPWKCCQLLSFFREAHKKKLSKKKMTHGKLMVEVRWFYSYGDLDARSQKYEPESVDEIYETDHVAVLDASLILGRLVLGTSKDDSLQYPVPTVARQCRKIFFHLDKDLVELFDITSSTRSSRGVNLSAMMKDEGRAAARDAAYKFLGITASLPAAPNQLVVLPKPALVSLLSLVDGKAKSACYTSCLLGHPLPQWMHKDVLCKEGFPNKWNLCVGDVVAVHLEDGAVAACNADEVEGRYPWYPYVVPWSHAQVTAIFRGVAKTFKSNDEGVSVKASEIFCEIRWFPRLSEALKVRGKTKDVTELITQASNDSQRGCEQIIEGNQVMNVGVDSLLGPIHVDEEGSCAPRYLPLNRRFIGSTLHCDGKGKPTAPKRVLNAADRLKRGVTSVSRAYTSENKQNFFAAVLQSREERDRIFHSSEPLGMETQLRGVMEGDPTVAPSPSQKRRINFGGRAQKRQRSVDAPLESIETVRVTKCVNPFHVDVSGLRSFYKKVEIVPPIDSYDEHFSRLSSARSDQDNKWFVSMGDTVALEIEQAKKTTGCVHYPFKVSWAPAEIVSIYQVHESRDACLRLRDGQANGEDEREVLMEVRWLYRPWEVPGAKKAKSPPSDSLLEVFETDQVDTCPAESILSPVQLHDSNKRDDTHASSIRGMPIIHFQCQRLWSILRSTFVPSGALGSRASRGRMYSSFKSSLQKLQIEDEKVAASSQPPQDLTNWGDAFKDAIQKLSIAEAAQDTQDRGMVLPGRERERKQISSFLRNAIRGVASGNDYDDSVRSKSSTIFIAGPPGTGKTATVKSLVHELKNDQYEGILPAFNFVSVNGMECRSPYDAYVKFWEELRREKLASQDAVHELENYFCGDGEKTNSVIVLLIDEIDYLNTNRETVLYNFFDWPLRATRARLVVIGISNTIDLPERLQPRVQSRIGGTRCNYQAYDVPQTIRIIKSRLGMSDESTPRYQVFDEDAIKFAARKTANLSGDIRKAFRMCKTAAEAVYNEHISSGREPTSSAQPLVRIQDIQRHSKDAYTAVLKRAIRGLAVHEALLMVALGSLKKASGSEEIYFDQKDLLQKMRSMASASGERMYTEFCIQLEDVSNMVTNLAGHGLVAVRNSSNPMIPYVKLDLDPFEIVTGLRDTRHSRLAEKWLSDQRLFG